MRLMSMTAVALAVPLGVSLQATAAQQPGERPQQTVGTTGTVAAAEVEDIVDDPEEYYGERVTVSGEVSEVFGDGAFRIREEGIIDVDDTLLVIRAPQRGKSKTAATADQPESAPRHELRINENQMVQVHGTVRKFVRNELERNYGVDFADLGITDPYWFDTYESRPVLIAERIDARR
jgi:hypothetical protein